MSRIDEELENMLEPPEPVFCIVCNKEAIPTNSGYVEHPYLDGQHDEDGPWWSGDDLPEADETPLGFVCANCCYSQAMYNAASNNQKKALRRVLAAVRTIEDNLWEANEALAAAGMDTVDSADDFLDAIYADEAPEWTEITSREQKLEDVARYAKVKLLSQAQWDHAFPVTHRLKQPDPIGPVEDDEMACEVRMAASLVHIVMMLQDALDS